MKQYCNIRWRKHFLIEVNFKLALNYGHLDAALALADELMELIE